MKIKNSKTLNPKGKRILIRVDYNVPLSGKRISDVSRIKASLPTLKHLLEKGADRLILISHQGRPGGKYSADKVLKPHAAALSKLIKIKVDYINSLNFDEIRESIEQAKSKIVLLENIRFFSEEEACDRQFSKMLASLGDVFVNDAFATAHRKHASTVGITRHLPSYAGLLMQEEIRQLDKFMGRCRSPFSLVIGGAKIDTKIGVIKSFLNRADNFLLGGGIANTILLSRGVNIGKSIAQPDKVSLAKMLDKKMSAKNLMLHDDVLVAKSLNGRAKKIPLAEISDDEAIFDIGPRSARAWVKVLRESRTIIWNGPLGVYENNKFDKGTRAIARTIAIATKFGAHTLVGGGDSLDALKKFGISQKNFTHVSTGGGAMLEYLEGKKLPGITPLLK